MRQREPGCVGRPSAPMRRLKASRTLRAAGQLFSHSMLSPCSARGTYRPCTTQHTPQQPLSSARRWFTMRKKRARTLLAPCMNGGIGGCDGCVCVVIGRRKGSVTSVNYFPRNTS